MADSLHILIASSDPRLRDELRLSLEGLAGRVAFTTTVAELALAVDAARNRTPHVVLFELTNDIATTQTFVRDIQRAAPGTLIVATFQSDLFDMTSMAWIEVMRAGVGDFLRRPISTAELEAILRRADQQHNRAPVQQSTGKVISFLSNKGGVGKSTLAVNAACGLALRHPGRVLLVDASLQMGVAASMLDLHPTATLTDAAKERQRLDETLIRQLSTVHESGLHLLAAPANAIEAAEVDDATLARVLTLARRVFDYVIVDTFPLFDRTVIATLDQSDRVCVVLEGVVPALLGALKLFELLDQLGFPREKLRCLLNRHTSVAGGLTASDIATRLQRPIDLVLPMDRDIIVAANRGRPYAMSPSRWFGFGPPLKSLVDELELLGK